MNAIAQNGRARTPLTTERARELLHYDSETGNFHWLSDRGMQIKAGDPAGYLHRNNTHPDIIYRIISVDGRAYQAQRLAWLIQYGRPAVGLIGFRNFDSLDLRIVNLFELNHSQAQQRRRNNRAKTLPRGVTFGGKSYQAQSTDMNGKRVYLGYYSSADEAHAAYVNYIKSTRGEFADYRKK